MGVAQYLFGQMCRQKGVPWCYVDSESGCPDGAPGSQLLQGSQRSHQACAKFELGKAGTESLDALSTLPLDQSVLDLSRPWDQSRTDNLKSCQCLDLNGLTESLGDFNFGSYSTSQVAQYLFGQMCRQKGVPWCYVDSESGCPDGAPGSQLLQGSQRSHQACAKFELGKAGTESLDALSAWPLDQSALDLSRPWDQ